MSKKLNVPTFLRSKKSGSRFGRADIGTRKGFTLLELLIVIAIIAILATIVVLILNPTEILRKSRDAQRISDLTTLKSALGLYLTEVGSPSLGACGTNLYVSIDSGTGMSHTAPSPWSWSMVTSPNLADVDSTGWIPVSFESITGGSPLSNLPIDPVNQDSATAADRWFYTYTCVAASKRFEMTARLESSAFNNKMSKDGGQFSDIYEVGTKLDIITGTHPY